MMKAALIGSVSFACGAALLTLADQLASGWVYVILTLAGVLAVSSGTGIIVGTAIEGE